MKAGSTDDPETKTQRAQLKNPDCKDTRGRSTRKVMMIPFFFNSRGIYLVPSGQTVNKKYFMVVLTEFRKGFHLDW